jgi:hypothetical protein
MLVGLSRTFGPIVKSMLICNPYERIIGQRDESSPYSTRTSDCGFIDLL